MVYTETCRLSLRGGSLVKNSALKNVGLLIYRNVYSHEIKYAISMIVTYESKSGCGLRIEAPKYCVQAKMKTTVRDSNNSGKNCGKISSLYTVLIM